MPNWPRYQNYSISPWPKIILYFLVFLLKMVNWFYQLGFVLSIWVRNNGNYIFPWEKDDSLDSSLSYPVVTHSLVPHSMTHLDATQAWLISSFSRSKHCPLIGPFHFLASIIYILLCFPCNLASGIALSHDLVNLLLVSSILTSISIITREIELFNLENFHFYLFSLLL